METRRRKRRRLAWGRISILAVLLLGFVALVNILITNIAPAVDMMAAALERAEESFEYIYSNQSQQPSAIEEAIHSTDTYLPLVSVCISDIVDTGYLTLVNPWHRISSEPDFGLLAAAWPTVPVSRVDGMYLHISALRAAEEMFNSARHEDINGLFVSSGFRGYDLQRQLYIDSAGSGYVFPPGYSEHHTGLGVDIMATGLSMWELGDSSEGRWLANNSYRYGLILRYPQGSEHITGAPFEPWHFRYVGRPHAYFMRKHNLLLEEYIQHIQAQESFSFVKNGITYHILHQTPQNGMIYVPYGLDFAVSSDNMGGVIIWTTKS